MRNGTYVCRARVVTNPKLKCFLRMGLPSLKPLRKGSGKALRRRSWLGGLGRRATSQRIAGISLGWAGWATEAVSPRLAEDGLGWAGWAAWATSPRLAGDGLGWAGWAAGAASPRLAEDGPGNHINPRVDAALNSLMRQ